MSDHLPNWPQSNQRLVDRMSGEQRFVNDYPYLRRAPTRAEIFHPYIPADILEDRPEPMDPRVQEAIDRLVRDAENDAIAMANDEHERDGYEFGDESEEMDIDPEDEEMSVITVSDDEHEHVCANAPENVGEPSARVHNTERAVFRDTNTVEGKSHVNYCTGSYQFHANVPQSGLNDPNLKAHAGFKGETSGMSLSSQQPGDARELTQTYHKASVSSSSNLPMNWPPAPSAPEAQSLETLHKDKQVISQRHLVPITPSQDQDSRQILVDEFRREVLQDWIQDTLAENGIHNPTLTALDIYSIEVEEAIRNLGLVHGRPYLLFNQFIRHDWHPRSGDCIYTVQTPSGRQRGSAEGLEVSFSGVRYAVWNYWGERGHVRKANVERHLLMMGRHGFYQILMWPWMDEEVWLSMWRNRRASRRG
jgi:hypothetical protein